MNTTILQLIRNIMTWMASTKCCVELGSSDWNKSLAGTMFSASWASDFRGRNSETQLDLTA